MTPSPSTTRRSVNVPQGLGQVHVVTREEANMPKNTMMCMILVMDGMLMDCSALVRHTHLSLGGLWKRMDWRVLVVVRALGSVVAK